MLEGLKTKGCFGLALSSLSLLLSYYFYFYY